MSTAELRDEMTQGEVARHLGAGGFWVGIAAMDGPRRSPGKSVEALSEAIDVVQGNLGSIGARRGVPGQQALPRLGRQTRPKVGCCGSRARRRMAGCPATAAYRRPDLERGNAIVDEAPAGREPRGVRRLLNVSGVFADRAGVP